MDRDLELFPDDDNGEVLWRMAQQGDNLAAPREIDFSVVFAEEQSALRFAMGFLRAGYKVQLMEYEEQSDGLIWDVTVCPMMVPVHGEIGVFEEMLAQEAAPFGGRNDGWGCLTQS